LSLLRLLDVRLHHSVIGLATNTTLDPADADYRWQDRGLVLESLTKDDLNAAGSEPRARRSGKHWLAYGSFLDRIEISSLIRNRDAVADAQRISIAQQRSRRMQSRACSLFNERAIIISSRHMTLLPRRIAATTP